MYYKNNLLSTWRDFKTIFYGVHMNDKWNFKPKKLLQADQLASVASDNVAQGRNRGRT